MPPKNFLTSYAPTEKIPLPAFLKLLTSSSLTMDKAMVVASKIYKTHNTPATLAQLTDGTLSTLKVDDKEQRKLVLAAVKPAIRRKAQDPAEATAAAAASISASSSKKKLSPKKRKRDDDLNEFLSEGPPDKATAYGSLEFDELLNEEALVTKSAVVNRAPVMTAWAMVVAERMGFKREEALSIASVFTEMNVTSKGVKLGIFEKGRGKGMEPIGGSGQPYVDFMGRSPVFTTRSSQWRALLKGEPVPPSSAYAYITTAFRQTAGHILGAMRLLAGTYTPRELNRVAFGLYAGFRPSVDGWGKKGEIRCDAILMLRKEGAANGKAAEHAPVVTPGEQDAQESDAKKSRKDMTVEEYEAALDAEGYDGLFVEAG